MSTEMRRTAHQRPERRLVRLPLTAALLISAAFASHAERLDMQFLGPDGVPVAGAVIALRSLDPARPPAAPVDAVMDQRERAFLPHVIVVTPGSRVRFPNSDSISHQVYSFSAPKKFQLPLYRGNPNPPVVFDKSGFVTLGCNIHDKMRGYILVTPAHYSGRTDATGRWSLDTIQPGQYEAQVWHPHAREVRMVHEQHVSVAAGAGQAVTMRALMPLRLREPSDRPTGWDAY